AARGGSRGRGWANPLAAGTSASGSGGANGPGGTDAWAGCRIGRGTTGDPRPTPGGGGGAGGEPASPAARCTGPLGLLRGAAAQPTGHARACGAPAGGGALRSLPDTFWA